MRYLILLILTGCSNIKYPVWLGDDGIDEMCESTGVYDFTHRGETKQFTVTLMDWRDVMDFCTNITGVAARACIINDYFIYAPDGVTCPESMAHEVGHGFGVTVHRPKIHEERA